MGHLNYIDSRGLPVFIDFGGDCYTIRAGGKEFFFEMHDYFGPNLVNKRTGAIRDRQPGPRSPFWHAVDLWDKQGRRVDENGICVWEEPPQEGVVRLIGNHYAVVHDGEDPDEVRRRFLEEIGIQVPAEPRKDQA